MAPDAERPPSLLDTLMTERVLISTGVDGLYGRGEKLERLVAFISRWVLQTGRAEHAEVLRFPPLIARHHFETSGYFKNFPNLVGTVHCFCGDEETYHSLLRAHDHGEDWTEAQGASDLVMLPAACYPVYPVIAERGPLSLKGQVIDASSYCFRHEPSKDPGRMQMFRMHERIFIGTSNDVGMFRDRWMAHAVELANLLELPHEVVPANDLFFGRVGRIMARSQRRENLKLELQVPLASDTAPTACVSFNLHLTKLAKAFGLVMEDGESAYTGCVGFGLERLAMAVLRHHGIDQANWPERLNAGLHAHDELLSL